MNTSLLCLVCGIVALSSCQAQKPLNNNGILTGTIGIYEGNCMPGPDVKPCEPKPISTKIYITSPAQSFALELLRDSTSSNSEGFYRLTLPPGSYSLFLQDGNEMICDNIQCNPDCYCTPFLVQSDSTTVVDANIDHAVW